MTKARASGFVRTSETYAVFSRQQGRDLIVNATRAGSSTRIVPAGTDRLLTEGALRMTVWEIGLWRMPALRGRPSPSSGRRNTHDTDQPLARRERGHVAVEWLQLYRGRQEVVQCHIGTRERKSVRKACRVLHELEQRVQERTWSSRRLWPDQGAERSTGNGEHLFPQGNEEDACLQLHPRTK